VERSLRALDPHALLLIHTYSSGPEAVASRRVTQRLGELSRAMAKPLAFCAFAQQAEVEALKTEASLPVFTEIEGAVRALAASRDRHARPARLGPLPPPQAQQAGKVKALLSGAGVLTTDAALDLCGAFNIPVAPWAVVEDAEAASFAASAMGYPVALKGLTTEVSHKSDAGLVALGITDAEALRAAFAEVSAALERHAPQAPARRVMVQPMLSRGHEVIIGGKRDPSFGPVLMFGLGGIYVEILEDVTFRLAPLVREDAEEMVDEVRGSRLLQGIRGQPSADMGAIVEALLGMSRLLVDCPEIFEIDVNPLLVFERGAAAVDARAVVESQQ
jgi:acetyltransferase